MQRNSRKTFVLTFLLLSLFCRFKKQKGTPFNILQDVTAFCKDGEMLLVLGRPGAGCSSFLRVVSNQREIFLSVDGDVRYIFLFIFLARACRRTFKL